MNETWKHNLAIWVPSCLLIGFVCYVTQSASPLWALILPFFATEIPN